MAKDCDLLEKLQRCSARFVKGDYRTTSSVSQMLHDLGDCGPPSQRAAIAKGQGGLYRPKEFELNGRVYKGLKSLMLTFYCKEVAVSTTG